MARTRTRGRPGTERCQEPDCGAGPFSRRGLAIHRRLKHGLGAADAPSESAAARRESVGTKPRVLPGEPVLLEEGRKLVANLTVVATFVSMVLPTTGTTIIRRLGDRPAVDPLSGQPIIVDGVQQTKRGIGAVLMDAARQDERILEGIRKFNRFFELEDAVELAMSLGAAVAVDMGVDPHVGLELPGIGELRPIESLIGDVVEDLEAIEPPKEPAGGAASPNGRASDGAAVVPGGVAQT